MSRSFRHNDIHGNAGGSEKQDKRIYNRSLRRNTRIGLNNCNDLESIVLPEVRDVSNPWSMAKDGKRYSGWMAEYHRTLDNVTRTRDGRSRRMLVCTDATIAFSLADGPRRFSTWYDRLNDDELDRKRVRWMKIALDLIRK